MRASRAQRATLLAGALLAMLTFGGASAQVEKLPPYLQETLAQIGPVFQSDIGKIHPGHARRLSIDSQNRSKGRRRRNFRPALWARPEASAGRLPTDIAARRAYLDLHSWRRLHDWAIRTPTGRSTANIGWWFARQGIVTLNATYRLAPSSPWPGAVQDVRAMVAWARENATPLGADPNRIFLMGHSAGATHVASYIYDKSLQPAEGPGVAGAVLLSGRYRLEYDPADPSARGMQAYFGNDPAQYANRSPITHIRDTAKVPVFLAIAEYDNPGLDVRGAELLAALCQRDGSCPRFVRLAGHNHLSQVAAFNTPDEQLGREVLEFMRRGR